jgi:hypothetical protein
LKVNSPCLVVQCHRRARPVGRERNSHRREILERVTESSVKELNQSLGKRTRMNRSTIAKAALVIGIALFAGYLVWWIVPEYFKAQEDPRSQARLSRIASELNQSVPVMIDKETELMPAIGEEGMLIYNYRLVGYSAIQINATKFAEGAKQRVVQGACRTPETRDDFLKKGVTLRYSYYDKDTLS